MTDSSKPELAPQTNGNGRGFRCSPSFGKLAEALSKAQGAMEGAKKDSANPFFKSKYADLASVWEAIRKPLADNNLALMQFPRLAEGGVEIETVLAHSSGEWVSEILCLPVSKMDAQGVGSAITYGRRYGAQSITGVAPEDDDGNAAAASTKNVREKALAILQTAAREGTKALELAWKGISQEMRVACKNDLAGFKAEAVKVDGPREPGVD